MNGPVMVQRLARFSLVTADAGRLAEFYMKALGCRRIAESRLQGGSFRQLMDVHSDARCLTLRLGEEIIDLMEFDTPGQPYPAAALPSDILFQHFAIVTADMSGAWLGLSRTDGWTAITAGGPQRLPASSGGVTAFKFRDPEGHPLELLSFPRARTPQRWQALRGDRRYLGIDHSAISVGDGATSTQFYAGLGLDAGAHSRNSGAEQDNLDGLQAVTVDVTAMSPPVPAPHVELLCYHSKRAAYASLRSNDIAATRLVFACDDVAAPRSLTDPDGHYLTLLPNPNPRRTA